MRVAIVGSRGIESIDFDATCVTAGDVVVSGGAVGVDTLAAHEAERRGIPVVVYRPDYAAFGRAATHIRNRKIVDSCDRIVAFWDGKSMGTKSTIEYARKHGKNVQVIV